MPWESEIFAGTKPDVTCDGEQSRHRLCIVRSELRPEKVASVWPDDGPSQPDSITVEDNRRSDQDAVEVFEYANSITPAYRIKVGRQVPRLGFVGIRPSEEKKKTGEQVRQSQQAYERGVQESETFGDDAEVCHSRSVDVRWESRVGQQ